MSSIPNSLRDVAIEKLDRHIKLGVFASPPTSVRNDPKTANGLKMRIYLTWRRRLAKIDLDLAAGIQFRAS